MICDRSYGFVDRIAFEPVQMIHQFTRNDTKKRTSTKLISGLWAACLSNNTEESRITRDEHETEVWGIDVPRSLSGFRPGRAHGGDYEKHTCDPKY